MRHGWPSPLQCALSPLLLPTQHGIHPTFQRKPRRVGRLPQPASLIATATSVVVGSHGWLLLHETMPGSLPLKYSGSLPCVCATRGMVEKAYFQPSFESKFPARHTPNLGGRRRLPLVMEIACIGLSETVAAHRRRAHEPGPGASQRLRAWAAGPVSGKKNTPAGTWRSRKWPHQNKPLLESPSF